MLWFCNNKLPEQTDQIAKLFIHFLYNPVEIVTKLITGWSELDTECSDF